MIYKPMPVVARFIAEFEKLDEQSRHKAIGEIAGFCVGYREGQELPEIVPVRFIEDDSFDDADGEPQVQSEAGAKTLAETMTEMDVLPHRGKTGSKAPAPKGWS
jgi:hypothetical protein